MGKRGSKDMSSEKELKQALVDKEDKYLNSNGKEDIRKFIEWLDEKLDNNEVKGKNYGILTQKIEKDLNIKIKWRYHIERKSEFYKLLTTRRVKIAKNRKKVLEVYKY